MSDVIEKKAMLCNLIRDEVKALSAYHVPSAAGFVKLDAMENPFAWPEEMRQKWLELMRISEPNRYPDASAAELVRSIKETFSVPEGVGLVLGNGSDELIQMLLMALKPDAKVMAPSPSFVMYEHIAKTLGLQFIRSPLTDSFELDVPAMLESIEINQPAIIFIAYPNNPTGNLFRDEDIDAVIEASDGLVIIDEAYQPFAKKSYLSRVETQPNVLVMRTVSKLGLAGLRLGYLVGNADVIEHIEKIRLPYNINTYTQLTACFAFEHIDVLDQQANEICTQRHWLSEQLNAISQVTVYDSSANFILFSLNHLDATLVFEALKKEGILIKNLNGMQGLPKGCLRVTVGLHDQNRLFVEKLNKVLS